MFLISSCAGEEWGRGIGHGGPQPFLQGAELSGKEGLPQDMKEGQLGEEEKEFQLLFLFFIRNVEIMESSGRFQFRIIIVIQISEFRFQGSELGFRNSGSGTRKSDLEHKTINACNFSNYTRFLFKIYPGSTRFSAFIRTAGASSPSA